MAKVEHKVIERDRFVLSGDAPKKLSYEMIFLPKQEEPTSIDLLQALERSNREWAARLADEKQKAVKQGYEAGFTDGEAKARSLIRDQIRPAELALQEAALYMQQYAEQLKPELLELVFLLAAKVVGVPVDSAGLKALIAAEIQSYLQELAEKTSVHIRVADPDYDTVQHVVQETPVKNAIEIIRDTALKPGEYRIETNFELISRSLEQRLDDFRKSAGLRFLTE